MKRYPLTGEPHYLQARGLARAVRRMADAWRKAWTPRIAPDPVAWVEGGGVILPSAVAARGNGGRLSFASRPYWRAPLRWFVADGVERIVVVVAAQCGKSTFNIACSVFAAEWLPGPSLYLMPSEEHAEDLVRDRLRPIFQASPFAKGLKTQDMRLGGVSFPSGGSLTVIGVGSPNALKSRPARNVFFDEYDEAARYNQAAGSAWQRALTRVRTYGSIGRVVGTSTPTTEDKGIWPLYEASRRHEWHVPCPHCGAFQPLEMSGIKWPRTADGDCSASPAAIESGNLAWYECNSCHEKWTDAQKKRAVSDGHLVCLDPELPPVQMGIHISVLYSPDVSISKIACRFLTSLDDPEELIQFRNEWLGEPRREIIRTTSTDQAHLATLALPGYEMPAPDWWQSDITPRAPEWVRGITWGFDVQGAEVWGLCRGWGDHGESIVLWCGSFRGGAGEDLEGAAQAFRREWIGLGGELIQPRAGYMDSGYRTHEVYRICSRTPKLTPSKGIRDGKVGMMETQVDRQDGNRRTVGQVNLHTLWTTYWQDQVAAELEAGPGRGRGVCHLPSNAPTYLYRHLLAERKVAVRTRNGTMSYVWKAHSSENHLRDCMVYARAAAGVSRLLDLRAMKTIPQIAPVTESESGSQVVAAPPPKKLTGLAALVAARNAGSMGKTAQIRTI